MGFINLKLDKRQLKSQFAAGSLKSVLPDYDGSVPVAVRHIIDAGACFIVVRKADR
jgi:hypothetical protein